MTSCTPRRSHSAPMPFAMLAGTLVTIAGFVPVGFAASSAGEYTFSLFAVVGIALIVSWFVAVVFAPLLGVAHSEAAEVDGAKAEPGSCCRLSRLSHSARCRQDGSRSR